MFNIIDNSILNWLVTNSVCVCACSPHFYQEPRQILNVGYQTLQISRVDEKAKMEVEQNIDNRDCSMMPRVK